MPRLLFTFFIVAGLLSGTDRARAVKINAYTFNDATSGVGGVTDSVSGVNGTLVDPAGTFGSIAGGQLNLTANNDIRSNQIGDTEDPTTFLEGAYVDLPNGILNSGLTSGDALEVSIESWFTVEQNRSWARLWDFGMSNLGEDAATSGDNSDYFAFTPQSGSTNTGASIESQAADRPNNFPATEASAFRLLPNIGGGDPETPAPLPAGVEHHVVLTIDGNDTSAGVAGTMRFFWNGAEVGSGPVPETMQLNDFANITGDPFAIPAVPDRGPDNNWIGRSNWGDFLFDGHVNELNIYNTALDGTEVTSSFATGPVTFDAPTIYVNRDTGEITVINETGVAQELAGLAITSELGVLDASGLTVPSDFEIQVPANANTINLADTNGTGVDLPASATAVSLGNIWQRSPFEDVEAAFDLVGSDSGNAAVVFFGDAILRSDFDADGDIDLDDYAVFVANANRTVSGLDGYFLGDIDLSGTVDRDDFRLFKADFFAAGGTAAALAAYTVPEPTSTALLALALIGGLNAKRRKA